MRLLSVMVVFLLSACAGLPPAGKKGEGERFVLTESRFADLPGWGEDHFDNFAKAFERSCRPLLKRSSQDMFGARQKDQKLYGRNQDWQIACRQFEDIPVKNAASLRRFFEQNFVPYQVSDDGRTHGLFTGYYEPSLNGSRTRKGPYQIQLRQRPDDLVMVDLGAFREELKGKRIAGRVQGGTLRPYEDRAQIMAGQLPAGQDKPLVWVDDAVAAFFLQIQGSGIVTLDDGTTMRIGYDGQNGHPYYAIGRSLVQRGILSKEEVSLQSIENWLRQNPGQAQSLMNENKSYVFFRELKDEGPVGAQGVVLTPLRSLAIDRSLIPYGVPVWLEAENPDPGGIMIQRLMITQDTGGAITGPVRGDVFWGYGDRAEKMAGSMKSQGRYWLLLPKTL